MGTKFVKTVEEQDVQVKIVQMKIVKVKTDQVRSIGDTSGFIAKLSLEFFWIGS